MTDVPGVELSRPLLAAVLIVRDEAHQLADCLATLPGVVDEVVVYDTGSRDGTREVARAAGARVVAGYWDDDFGRARNAALDAADAPWALVLDADERVDPDVDAAGLRRLLAATRADVLTVVVRNQAPEALGGSYRHPGPRLLRRETVRYSGRVHEQPWSSRGGRPSPCPPEVLRLDHLGYADPQLARDKAARNAALALAEVARLQAGPPSQASSQASPSSGPEPLRLAKALLDAGRSLVGCGRRQEAVDAFEAVRELVPRSAYALEATDALARLLLADGGLDDVVPALAEELRAGGVDGRYCDWLRAQALAQLGGVDEAADLLAGIDLLRDAAGREHDLGQVIEARALVEVLAGRAPQAVRDLAEAMLVHGRAAGRGPLLLDLWGDQAPAGLARLLRQVAAGAAKAATDGVVAELALCRRPGPEVAAALSAPEVLAVAGGAGW